MTLLEANGFIPTVASTPTAIILGRAVCYRYDVGDSYLAAVTTMAEAGMAVVQAVRLEEAATTALCPEYADASESD